MPALNEERTILDNIKAINFGISHGLINKLVLVLDGCTDKTAHIVMDFYALDGEMQRSVMEPGAPTSNVIDLPEHRSTLIFHGKNHGKGASFAEAVWKLDAEGFFQSPNPVLVNIDADALNLFPSTPFRLAKELLESQRPMLLGNTYEQNQVGQTPGISPTHDEMNGFRAISAEALRPLINKDPTWMRLFPTGLCMEQALTSFLGRDSWANTTSARKLVHAPPGKNIPGAQQGKDAAHIGAKIQSFLDGQRRHQLWEYPTLEKIDTSS